MKIMLKSITGESLYIDASPEETFRDLRSRIQNESGLSLNINQLNFKGRKITDDQTVANYLFQDSTAQEPGVPDKNVALHELECAVPGCINTQTYCPNKVFFRFPITDARCQHWLLVCRRVDLLEQSSAYVNHHHAVCSDHFIADHFVDDSKQKLKKGAIPTVFPFNQDYLQSSNELEGDDVIIQDKCEVLIKEELHTHSDESLLSYVDNYNLDLTGDGPDQLCRLCASSINDVVYIYSSSGIEQQIAEKINSCLPVTVKSSDPLPKQLCPSCVTKLNMCHEFAEACIQAEDKLRGLNNNKYFWSHSLFSKDNINCGTVSDSEMQGNADEGTSDEKAIDCKQWKTSNGSLELNDVYKIKNESYCCPLCCGGNMTIQDKRIMNEGSFENGLKNNPTNPGRMARTPHVSETFLDGSELFNADSSEDDSNMWDEDNRVTMTDVDNGSREGSQEAVEEMFDIPMGENVNLYGCNDLILSAPSCRICGDGFKTIDLCLAHSVCHADSDIYPCSLCDLCFSTKSSFMNHCEDHKMESRKSKQKVSKRLVCTACGRRFNTEKTLKSHSCGNTPRPFKCSECGKFFRTEVRLLFHQQVHQGGNPVMCEYCGKEFSRENNLFDHVRLVHMGEKAHCCDQCGKTFQLKARLIAHQRVHTGERPFECDICGGKFYDKATLKGHRVTHLEVKPFQCEKCGRCFARKTLFKQHTLSHLNEERKRPRTYSCKICVSTTFPTYAKLIDHRKEIHPELEMNEVDDHAQVSKPFKCEDCGKSFAYRVTLVAHRRNHTGELPFQCEFCEKRFSQKRSLVLHRRTHTGEKPFVCKVCGKRFVQSAHLYSHQRLHTGEKPYACEVCGEAFRLKDVRDAHQRKHTGERPFKCNVCGKAFRTSHSYYQHMWIHQGKKPYPCNYCGKAFRRSNGLKIHIRIHTGEKPHACDVCGRCFAQKQDMKKHRNLHVAGKLQ